MMLYLSESKTFNKYVKTEMAYLAFIDKEVNKKDKSKKLKAISEKAKKDNGKTIENDLKKEFGEKFFKN
ncbi:MAG: hypothetical protein IPJ13_07010 [Saprospiraceae bacterium]|nr:hypothetical protein [Saprospiraceae bacterium]